jgi:hypothetical protein
LLVLTVKVDYIHWFIAPHRIQPNTYLEWANSYGINGLTK